MTMMTRKTVLPLLASAVAIGLAGAQQGEQVGDAVRGKQLYFEHGCYGCHGYGGQTGVRNLVGTGSPIVENVDLFITFLRLRADAPPPFPTTSMPNYAESSLGDTAARDIFSYIRTFTLDSPPAENTPALRAILESVQRPQATAPARANCSQSGQNCRTSQVP